MHCGPVPPAPHTEGRLSLEGKVGVYLSKTATLKTGSRDQLRELLFKTADCQ